MADPKPVRGIIVAIDGPAGAGKSTIARQLARHFGLLNLESGAMYRAFALKALRSGIPLDESTSLERLAAETVIRLEPGEEDNRVLLDGEDVTGLIRNQTVTEAASQVSVFPAVRSRMVRLQQQLGASGGVVMEGRDIGTKVFPDADLKIFLDADPVVREQRRMAQQKIKREVAADVAAELRQRDQRDRTRAASPLVPALDAIMIDSTSLTEDEVLARVEELAKKKLSH